MIRDNAQINKTTNMPNGVSRFIEIDKRYPTYRCVCFTVLVKRNGEFWTKKFRVTKDVSENQAQKAAINFRRYYEECETTGMKFDFHKFDNWKLTS